MSQNTTLQHFTSLYNAARLAYAPALDAMEQCFTQYETGRTSSKDATGIIRNVTYELIEAQISSEIPRPRVTPVLRDEVHERNAEAVEVLCRDLRSRLPFERLNDIDERLTYVAGGSVWLVEWDNEKNQPSVSVIDPRGFIPQPGVTELERMDYCFIVTPKSPEEIQKTFSRSPSSSLRDANGLIPVVVCYYKDGEGNVCRYVFTQGLELSHDRDLFCRRDPVTGEEIHDEVIGRTLHTRGGRIPATALPYYKPSRFPIAIRRNVSKNGSLLGQSDCAVIRPQQSAINRIESRIHQKLVRACVMPYMPEECRIAPSSSIFGEVIKTDSTDGTQGFGVIDTTPDISQDIAQSDRLYEHAKKLLGITDSYTGHADRSATSGYAIALRVSQSAGRLRSRRIMKNALYADLDRLIMEQYLAFCDVTLSLGYTDTYGRRHKPVFSRYEFLEFADGAWKYDDGYMFSVDRSVTSDGETSQGLWETTLAFFRDGLFGDTSSDLARKLCWNKLEQLGYPDAQNTANIFDTESPKEAERK